MKLNMDQWTKDLLEAPAKKAVPVLSFPSIQLLGITVKDLISDSDLQARGMKAVADRTNAGAAVSLMDLSLEAECFGAPIRFSDDEVPTVTGPVIPTEVDAWSWRKRLRCRRSARAARRSILMRSKRSWA